MGRPLWVEPTKKSTRPEVSARHSEIAMGRSAVSRPSRTTQHNRRRRNMEMRNIEIREAHISELEGLMQHIARDNRRNGSEGARIPAEAVSSGEAPRAPIILPDMSTESNAPVFPARPASLRRGEMPGVPGHVSRIARLNAQRRATAETVARRESQLESGNHAAPPIRTASDEDVFAALQLAPLDSGVAPGIDLPRAQPQDPFDSWLSDRGIDVSHIRRNAWALGSLYPSTDFMGVDVPDGLGDRDRSLSPDAATSAWDVIQSTLTPDPQPPSAGSSFAYVDEMEPPCDPLNELDAGVQNPGDSQRAIPRSRLSYADILRVPSDASPSEMADDPEWLEGMHNIVRGLASRQDIPDEWWLQAGLTRSMSWEDDN